MIPGIIFRKKQKITCKNTFWLYPMHYNPSSVSDSMCFSHSSTSLEDMSCVTLRNRQFRAASEGTNDYSLQLTIKI